VNDNQITWRRHHKRGTPKRDSITHNCLISALLTKMRSSISSFWGTIATINGLTATIHATDSSTVTGKLGDAQRITNNPQGAVYIAELPTTQAIQGSIVATSANVLGTEFTINFANLPSEGGPFCESVRCIRAMHLFFSVSHPH
jgi:hypothetical protein